MDRQALGIFVLLGAVVLLPIALRPRHEPTQSGPAPERSLVVITPHNAAIRFEFAEAFRRAHWTKHREHIRVDYRTPGGTSEIVRYVSGQYVGAFRHHWTLELGKPWSHAVERSFANARVSLPEAPEKDTLEQAARRAFLHSAVGCRMDVFFGGGAFDFQAQAAAGFLVDSGVTRAHPEIFHDSVIPSTWQGEPFWDPAGRWVGTVLSSFGICSNPDLLSALHIATPPERWEDLANPRYFGQIALSNPAQSSSANKAFEMLIQQQIHEEHRQKGAAPGQDPQAVAAGWSRALRLLMKIGANAKSFTDASAKVALDVSSGEAAAGMSIDFSARFQSESMRGPDGRSPLIFREAIGGTSVGVDPIGLFRGAPDPALAREFIEFVVSEEGQKLWNWKPNSPGGPRRYALRRLPLLPSLYDSGWRKFRSDPDLNPYEMGREFSYQAAWTGGLFRTISFIFRVMCVDSHDELEDAWRALIEAGFPPEAMAVFENVERVDYAAARGSIREGLGAEKIREVELARELGEHFRNQYRHARDLARRGH